MIFPTGLTIDPGAATSHQIHRRYIGITKGGWNPWRNPWSLRRPNS